MLKLYHGSSDHEIPIECDDLTEGYDGMIHLYPDYDPVSIKYGTVIECDSDLVLDDIPIVPDLVDWNPFRVAEELEYRGLITKDELDEINKYIPLDDPARDFDVEKARIHYEDETGVLWPKSTPLKEMMEEDDERRQEEIDRSDEEEIDDLLYEWSQSYWDPGIDLKSLDTIESVRDKLFHILINKGIKALKYKNMYEEELKEDYSIAVIDPIVLKNPKVLKHPRWDPVSSMGSAGKMNIDTIKMSRQSDNDIYLNVRRKKNNVLPKAIMPDFNGQRHKNKKPIWFKPPKIR